jgi:hypothetical protein
MQILVPRLQSQLHLESRPDAATGTRDIYFESEARVRQRSMIWRSPVLT